MAINSKITIEEIIKESGKHYYKNLIIETNRTLDVEGNIICIKDDVLIVVGKLVNNLYMVKSIMETLEEHPQVKYVIWNKSETLTEQAQNSLRQILNENIKIKFIFITTDFDKFNRNLSMRCLLIEE